MKVETYNTRHGGPWDRGSADAYYQRAFRPHYYIGDTYSSGYVSAKEMTEEEIAAYTEGYREQEASGDFKQWD